MNRGIDSSSRSDFQHAPDRKVPIAARVKSASDQCLLEVNQNCTLTLNAQVSRL